MAQSSTNTVVGYFSTQAEAQKAVNALRDAGFTSSQVGIAAQSSGYPSGSTASDTGYSNTGQHESFWDKVKDFFEGGSERERASGMNRTDAGVNDSALDRTGSEQTDIGLDRNYDRNYAGEYGQEDLHHSLSGLSVPEQHSRYFSHRFSNSQEGAVVTVSAAGREEEAEAILEEYGADLGDNAESYDYQGSTAAGLSSAAGNRDYTEDRTAGRENITGDRNIRLYGEVLRVHKDRVSRGEVVVRKEVITENQTVQVPVTREELVVERRAVSGEQPANDANFKGEEIRIPLSEERASVDKQAVVREEVHVGKREVTQVESRNEQVRREELRVEDETARLKNKNLIPENTRR